MADEPVYIPQAFPCLDRSEGMGLSMRDPGMTLRDWFAGQALVSLANEHHGNDWGPGGIEHGPRCARKAYAIADAMLAARGQH